MTKECWTTADALNGLCEFEDVGDERATTRVAAPEQLPEEQLPDLGDASIFERELAAYRRDPDLYKARNPPPLVVKLLEVERQQRQQAAAEARERLKPIPAMSNHELQQKILPALATLPAVEFVPTVRQGLEHIIAGFVVPALQPAARDHAAQLVGWLESIGRRQTPP
jgi:hypothetical protein